ncbi:MAG: class I SAM-dependent methyltransferase [Candidatus Methylomirabilales bacterium]
MTIPPSISPDAFRAFEHEGWQKVSQQYHNAFADLTSQAITPLLDAVEVTARVRVLDVATGPGYVAGAAAQRGAAVTGIDFSSAMVAEARRHYPKVDFREGDAEDLPFAEGSFDGVVMNFGLLHFGRPELALTEAHRVLRPGGKLGFTVWAKPEEAVGFGIVLDAIQKHGKLDVALPQGPNFFRFSDSDECHRTLLGAGFVSPAVQRISQTWRLTTSELLFESMLEGTVRTAGLLRAQPPDAMDGLRTAIRHLALQYKKGDVIKLPMPAILASAKKP